MKTLQHSYFENLTRSCGNVCPTGRIRVQEEQVLEGQALPAPMKATVMPPVQLQYNEEVLVGWHDTQKVGEHQVLKFLDHLADRVLGTKERDGVLLPSFVRLFIPVVYLAGSRLWSMSSINYVSTMLGVISILLIMFECRLIFVTIKRKMQKK